MNSTITFTAVYKTLLFQFLCIATFSFSYFIMRDQFEIGYQKYSKIEYLDTLFLASTIQTGVGYGVVNPLTNNAKMLLIAQHFVMISANAIMLYIFSLHLLSIK